MITFSAHSPAAVTRPRHEIPEPLTWNLRDIYAEPADWEAACADLGTRIEQFVTDLSAGLLDIGPLNVRDRVDKIDVPDAVRKRVMAYIEAAEQGAA
jgi:oligoendopeptidase F